MLSQETIDGFVQRMAGGQAAAIELPGYQADFLPGGRCLVVTFESMTLAGREPDLTRPVWGQSMLLRRGHSVLGVKRVGNQWYRHPDLHRVFRALQKSGVFARFDRVMFYGLSMGGYAALAFAETAPGCTVLAMSPQSTLAPELAWFDQRFSGARKSLWEGDFVDGAVGAAAAGRVYVCFDPRRTKDRLQVERLPVHNRVDLKLPHCGHVTTQALQALGLLGQVVDGALDGSLSAAAIRQMARQRVHLADYHVSIAERGVWLPRRLAALERALTIKPDHPGALKLQKALTSPDADEPAQPASGTQASPRRWPMGLVTGARLPLVYLNLPKSASTTVQNHLLYLLTGAHALQPQDIQQHASLTRSRETAQDAHDLISRQIDQGAVVFTFVRDPGRRAYACFHEKIMLDGRHSFRQIKQVLERDWGLRSPKEPGDVPLSLQRDNFAAFLRFVEANIAGDTPIRRDPHWLPQAPMLSAFRRHLRIDIVGRVENFAADMARILHRAGPRRVPDLRHRPWTNPPSPYTFEQVITPALQQQLDRLYEVDYVHLGYREPQ
jgi:hypothetical protein